MKTCEEMLFGISIDELVVFKASLVLLCFLSLVFILISSLAVWLRKIQRQIVCLTKNTCSLPLVISNFERSNSWKPLAGSAAYGASSSDGDGPPSDLTQETSFDSSLAQGHDAKSVHGSNTQEEAIASDNNNASNVQNIDNSSAAHCSTSNDSEQNIKSDKLKKDYMSLKGAKDHTYGKRVADSSQVESKMGRDERQNGKASNEEKDKDTNEDDHGYLVVTHSDKSSTVSEGSEDTKPPLEDESLYLIPIESKPEEDGRHKVKTESKGKRMANGVSKIDDRVSLLDDPEDYDYPSSQRVGKLTTFGHNADFQQKTQPGFTKDADVDDSGYLILQHAEGGASGKAGTSIPVGPFQARGTPENDGTVNATQGDDNSYDYIPTKDWIGPDDNSDSTTGKGKNVTNSSAEDNHDYLTVVHETDVNSLKEQEYSTDQIYSIIHDSNNNNNAGVQSEVFYVNQSVVQNLGVECSDEVPVYANNDAPHQTSMCNDNPAFCNVDESPLYDNP